MNSMQKAKILMIRQHFEKKHDAAFERNMTMVGTTQLASHTQIEDALMLSYSQGVMKAIDLILKELDT
jgi:acyl-[acyl carrier protein]--UDP-N-acetylglucosamine O-acyltransferase